MSNPYCTEQDAPRRELLTGALQSLMNDIAFIGAGQRLLTPLPPGKDRNVPINPKTNCACQCVWFCGIVFD